MEFLTGKQAQVMGKGVEVSLEIGYRMRLRMYVIYSQTASYIDASQGNTPMLEPILKFIDTVAQGLKIRHIEYLAAYMEVQAEEVYIGQGQSLLYRLFHIFQIDAELVLGQSRGNVGVGMGANIGVDSQGNARYKPLLSGKLADYFQLLRTFHIETTYTGVQGKQYFLVSLAYSGKFNSLSLETALEGQLYFTSAHAVHPEARKGYLPENYRVAVGLHCIMYVGILYSGRSLRGGIERTP